MERSGANGADGAERREWSDSAMSKATRRATRNAKIICRVYNSFYPRLDECHHWVYFRISL